MGPTLVYNQIIMKTLSEIKAILQDNPNFETPGQFCELIDIDKDEYDDLCRKAGTFTGEDLEAFTLIKKTIRKICFNIELRIANTEAYKVKGLIFILQQWNREGYGTEENRGKVQDAKDRWKRQSGWTNKSEIKF